MASQVALVEKNLPVNAGDRRDMGLIPGSGRSPGGGHGNPLQYCMENPMDRGAWRATVHRVTKSWTRLKRLSMQANLQIWNLPVMRTDRLYSREKMFFIIVNFSWEVSLEFESWIIWKADSSFFSWMIWENKCQPMGNGANHTCHSCRCCSLTGAVQSTTLTQWTAPLHWLTPI